MTEYKGDERRFDEATRFLIDRVAAEAAEQAATRVLGMFTDHDLTTKDGRGALRSDFRYSHQSRVGAQKIQEVVKMTVTRTAVGAVVLGICYAVWSAIQPHTGVGG